MAIISAEEYFENLRKQKPRVYMAGERVDSVVDNPMFRVGMNSVAQAYRCVQDPKYAKIAKVYSSIVGDDICRWTALVQNREDAIAKVKLMRAIGDYLVPCTYRCMTTDMLTAAWAVSYDIDQKYGTTYHQNVRNIVQLVQQNDWTLGGALVDPKGNRKLPPSKQSDPDLYLHIVERTKNGVIVKGAKAHCTAAAYTNLLCVMPMSRVLSEDDKEYAIGFFTPVDAEGITLICRPPVAHPGLGDLERPYSSKFGGHVEALVIFDHVFVPWERVFMCGEWEFGLPLMDIFSSLHTMGKCGCRAASMDLAIGAVALIADYNGVERECHIREYLVDMIINCELTYSCGLASAVEGTLHQSGVYVPKNTPAYVGKCFAAKKLGEDRYYMQEAGGGAVTTMVSEKELKNTAVRHYVEKYYRGRDGVTAEQRMRALRLIDDLTASEYAGWYHGMAITGGGTPGALRLTLFFNHDFEASKERAKRAAGIST